MDLKKRENESSYDYHRRIVYGKLVDKTLADADYSELAEALYGQPYAPDVARRMVYGSRKTLDAIAEDVKRGIKDTSVISELDGKIVELQKERQKFYDQRREHSKLVSAEAREEHLQEALIAAANGLNNTVGCMYDEVQIEPLITCDTEAGTEAVLVFSDWHFGLRTSNVFNEYNTEVCRQRVKHVVDMTVERIKRHRCRTLHIVVLGDLCHGAIHNSARVASEELVCDQLMQASEILAQSVEYLSQFVHKTVVYATYGNHARTVQNKNDSIHRDNMERLVPWWLKQRLSRYDDIFVMDDTGSEFIFVNACGYELCAAHGDNDSVRTSPRLLTTLFHKQFNRDVDYIVLGDKHHRESFDELGVSAMLCGALCGTDDYANDKRLYSTPSQLLLIFDPNVGLDAEYRIKCK